MVPLFATLLMLGVLTGDLRAAPLRFARSVLRLTDSALVEVSDYTQLSTGQQISLLS